MSQSLSASHAPESTGTKASSYAQLYSEQRKRGAPAAGTTTVVRVQRDAYTQLSRGLGPNKGDAYTQALEKRHRQTEFANTVRSRNAAHLQKASSTTGGRLSTSFREQEQEQESRRATRLMYSQALQSFTAQKRMAATASSSVAATAATTVKSLPPPEESLFTQEDWVPSHHAADPGAYDADETEPSRSELHRRGGDLAGLDHNWVESEESDLEI